MRPAALSAAGESPRASITGINFGAVCRSEKVRYSLPWIPKSDLEGSTQDMETSKPGSPPRHDPSDSTTSRQEVRCAVRFPLALPVALSIGHGERAAVTRNVSASGVLFDLDSPLNVGQNLHFSLRMPGLVLGTPHDVLVRCRGRVVRCSISQTQFQAAATIDEYQFAEQ
jgi:hypothetical protein